MRHSIESRPSSKSSQTCSEVCVYLSFHHKRLLVWTRAPNHSSYNYAHEYLERIGLLVPDLGTWEPYMYWDLWAEFLQILLVTYPVGRVYWRSKCKTTINLITDACYSIEPTHHFLHFCYKGCLIHTHTQRMLKSDCRVTVLFRCFYDFTFWVNSLGAKNHSVRHRVKPGTTQQTRKKNTDSSSVNL